MARFDLNSYETVESRIKRFYESFKDGRIITKIVFQDGDRTIVKALIYKDSEEQHMGLPLATGYAEETRVKEKSISKTGSQYEEVNYSSHTENAETSAIGRALANYNLQKGKRPSRSEMSKVQRLEAGFRPATDKQVGYLNNLIVDMGKLPDLYLKEIGLDPDKISFDEATGLISKLKGNGENQ